MRRISLVLSSLLLLSAAHASAQQMSVTFYALDKADAALITTPQGQRVLIDAGTNKDGKQLVKRFESEGITSLDVLIVTHFDKDHVGGADKILEGMGVSLVVIPCYPKESNQYSDFLSALSASEDTCVIRMGTAQKLDLDLEGVSCTLTSAHETDYGKDEENDFSLAARLRFGSVRFLFAGDAENARQRELLAEGDIDCDVLKVAHHGRMHEVSGDFLRAASPSIAFVPDGAKEPADPALLKLLGQLGAKVYRTQDGDLTVTTDGETVSVLER